MFGERVWRTLPILELTFGTCLARGSSGHFQFHCLLVGSVRRKVPAVTSNVAAYFREVSGEGLRRTLQFESLLLGRVRLEGPADTSIFAVYFNLCRLVL
jgi:hypothetical protein